MASEINIRYIGGPTLLLEAGGLKFLTDPTFDPKDSVYDTGSCVLHKLADPAIEVDKLGKINYVLLSHDHHFDNLDRSGRQFLCSADRVFTTVAAAERLNANSTGLKNWETIDVPTNDERILSITGTPCRHGPQNN